MEQPIPPTPSAAPPSHWLDDPAHVRLLWRGFLAVLVLMVLAEALITLHPHFEVERLFGFNAAYGFLACAAMIGVAKLLGRWLKRPDSYYEADDGAVGEAPASGVPGDQSRAKDTHHG